MNKAKIRVDDTVKTWSKFVDECGSSDGTVRDKYSSLYDAGSYLIARYDMYRDELVVLNKARVFVTIKRVIFNDPATIVLWADGTKTVVKCAKDEKFDPEKGFAMAIAKKAMGNEGWYYDIFKAYLPKEVDEK